MLPFAAWMHGPLAAEVTATLGDRDRLHALGLDARAVRQVWSDFVRGRSGVTWSRPWALFSLLRWASAHGLGDAEAVEPNIAEVAVQ